MYLSSGAKGTRTLDLYNAIVELSQLSYSPELPASVINIVFNFPVLSKIEISLHTCPKKIGFVPAEWS